ncbi:PEP-CTERM sorting domain-containing protein [Massilia sp. W12]|uniref:PEP-CTERM sorting domain-containing protein n=1 Tax=Massilia sp. W12 TaxID=3126507 RepID=UPI0030D1E8D5
MKTFNKTALRTTVIAAALALTSFSASAATNLSAVLHGGPQFTAAGGGFGGNSVTPGVWEVNFGNFNFYAFCLEPKVAFSGSSNHYSSASFNASDAIKRLYEGHYSSVIGSNLNNPAPKAKAFQLALWELNNDNGNLLSGDLRFNSLSNAVVADANAMLATALGNGVINNTYRYTSLTSDVLKSQKMLTVAAVPEPETYGMMAAGLGLLAFMARRKKRA